MIRRTERRRDKRIAGLVQSELSRLFIEEFQPAGSGLITVTRVDVSADLLTARIYVSVFGTQDKSKVLQSIESRKSYIRKILASRINLKYNPELIFSLDPLPDYEEKIDRLIEMSRKNDKRPAP